MYVSVIYKKICFIKFSYLEFKTTLINEFILKTKVQY